MNKIFKFMMAAVMMMAMVGFVACKKDDDKKSDDSQQQETYEESTSFEIIHNGQAVAAGATVEHTFTAEELDIDDADVALYVKNKRKERNVCVRSAMSKCRRALSSRC